MVKLWKKLPPLMADNFGFIEVINKTDGMGIIDDCSEYRTSAERRRRRRKSGEPEMRVVHTEISSEDVVSGTRQKILDTFAEYRQDFQPKFVLLSAGPCSAMIGTDLEETAEKIEQDSCVKAAALKLTGHKTYDTGISETLLALAKLLAKPGKAGQDGINLIGANALDWHKENASLFREWMEERGFYVIANLGENEKTENIARSAEASVNIAVTSSGLAAARYLEKEYGTPYIAAAPFGKSWSDKVMMALREKQQPENSMQSESSLRLTNQKPGILIIAEQLLGNAVRETLIRDYGMHNIQVCTFYTLDKTLAWPGDRRIRSEKDAQKLLEEGGYEIIAADPLLRCFASENTVWIDLPHKAFQLYEDTQPLPLLLGEHLNKWLDDQLRKMTGITGRTIL